MYLLWRKKDKIRPLGQDIFPRTGTEGPEWNVDSDIILFNFILIVIHGDIIH